jgi:hypothetical protein
MIAAMFQKLRSYRAGFRAEKWRAAAEQLREDDPQLYQRILSEATPEVEDAVRKDPDAFVALWLASAKDVGVI